MSSKLCNPTSYSACFLCPDSLCEKAEGRPFAFPSLQGQQQPPSPLEQDPRQELANGCRPGGSTLVKSNREQLPAWTSTPSWSADRSSSYRTTQGRLIQLDCPGSLFSITTPGSYSGSKSDFYPFKRDRRNLSPFYLNSLWLSLDEKFVHIFYFPFSLWTSPINLPFFSLLLTSFLFGCLAKGGRVSGKVFGLQPYKHFWLKPTVSSHPQFLLPLEAFSRESSGFPWIEIHIKTRSPVRPSVPLG